MGLMLNISENDNSLDFDLALSVAKYFGLNNNSAEKIVREVKLVVSDWQKIASNYGIPRSEQELMAKAFRH